MTHTWTATGFETAARLGNCLARDYAQAVFELLATYQDISASEAASRLRLHIRTAQEYLESLADLGIVERTEVHEGKRPYFRYALAARTLAITLDLDAIPTRPAGDALSRRIRERANARAGFTTARGDSAISSVTLWSGNGRGREEHRINLTTPQGRFLFHLPFPDAEPLSIAEIMREAELDRDLAPEVLDLVDILAEHEVIEVM